jgi:hypothetical protein
MGRWLAYLDARQDTPGCLFAVVPDVVGDAERTRARWDQWAPIVRNRGFRPAYVLQDGETGDTVPWRELSAVFIGGTTKYKLGPIAHQLTLEAKERGVHVHMGRVNSLRRLRVAAAWGCDTVDGTFLAFGPDVNTPRLCSMLRALDAGTQLTFTIQGDTNG